MSFDGGGDALMNAETQPLAEEHDDDDESPLASAAHAPGAVSHPAGTGGAGLTDRLRRDDEASMIEALRDVAIAAEDWRSKGYHPTAACKPVCLT